jgi:HD-GYP domain-containing protein (c-di-GMP phosphodiesterase class II)
MHPSIVPINLTTQLIREIARQLDALNSLQLPKESLHAVRLLQLRRLTRRIEALIPGHFGHGERTAHYARMLGEAIGLTDDQHIDLQYAALLHDIGLLTLPGRLLDETEAHTLDDYALIQSHPREGAALLNPYRFLYEAARLIAHHHERWDGAGYPYGLRGAYIPLAARILAIADVFDSIAVRSISLHSALRTLQASTGSQFDPALTTIFCVRLRDQDRFPALSVNAVSLTALTVEPTVDQLNSPHTSLSTF